ncbi:MAG TPA: hypothetical protein VGU66_14165 [Candidatus Elarobacter sp.]|nr:hypothetical protein [Candidatus Elarobacter sp.]
MSAVRADEPISSPAAAPVVLPPCRVVDASLTTPLDSKSLRGGEVFHFTATPADGQPVANGFGVVDFVRGARRGGKAGQIGVEVRYLELADGTHVPAMIAPSTDAPALHAGPSRNAPSIFSALGFAKGSGFHLAAGAIGVYNFVHFGGQAVLPVGTHMRIVLGDDYLTEGCKVT